MDIMAKLGSDIASLWSNYAGSYLNGIANTLLLALAATLIGCVIGFVCGVLQTIPCSKNDLPLKRGLLTAVRAIVRAYVEVFRGTPMVLQAVFIYYGLPYFTNAAMKFTNVWGAALLVVSINTGAYMAETVRGGIEGVDRGQRDAAESVGLGYVKTMRLAIIPQAMRSVAPALVNEVITVLKSSSPVATIGLMDMMRAAQSVQALTYRAFEPFLVVAVVYYVIVMVLAQVGRALEKRLL